MASSEPGELVQSSKPRPWLTIAVLILLGSAVFGGGPTFVLMYVWKSRSEGVVLDAGRARLIVATQGPLLAEVRALADSEAVAPEAKRQELARSLGALAIRVAPLHGAPTACIVFRRHGNPGETHEERLQWLPPVTAQAVHGGGLRLGVASEELADGWWWVAD